MARASASRELLASREDVWAFLAEPRHFSDWWPGVAAVTPGRRGLVPGARWEIHGVDRPTLLDVPLPGETVTGALATDAVSSLELFGNLHASAAYQRHLTGVLVERALLRAWRDA